MDYKLVDERACHSAGVMVELMEMMMVANKAAQLVGD